MMEVAKMSCFTFEAYVPSHTTSDGVVMMHNIRHQVQGGGLTRVALLQAFEQFLRGAGIPDTAP